VRTVVDCARDLPFDEALCVADSALRSGDVSKRELVEAADVLRGPGSRRAREVAESASAKAANPLESILHAICRGIDGLSVVQQLLIYESEGNAEVDLADQALRLVIEAEGYESHGTRAGFDKDCRRYTVLATAGWLVLRFTWTQVMFEPEWVAARIEQAVALQRMRLDRHQAA
jgi:very-short-patch-repair endonuclease